MIDLKFIRENSDLVQKNNDSRNVKSDVVAFLKLDKKIRGLQNDLDAGRSELKNSSKQKPNNDERARLQSMRESLRAREGELALLERERQAIVLSWPNINDPETPLGQCDEDNVIVAVHGEKQNYQFSPLPYFELPSVKPFIKLEEGVRVSGSRFYYLIGPLVKIQRAIFDVVFEMVEQAGFTPVTPPLLVRERAMFGTGHFPAERFEMYEVNPNDDRLFLIGTSEVPLISLHDGERLRGADLPKKYVAETACFRREAGSYGKDQQGILRVHQFQKIEMVAFVKPDDSREMHQEFLNLEKRIIDSFGLYYRVVDICSGDLGFPATRKFDIEAWFPSQNAYRELTSTSNTTDFQSHRLGITFQSGAKHDFVHTVNGTAVTDRLMLAVLEQFQTENGDVVLPPIIAERAGFARLSV